MYRRVATLYLVQALARTTTICFKYIKLASMAIWHTNLRKVPADWESGPLDPTSHLEEGKSREVGSSGLNWQTVLQ